MTGVRAIINKIAFNNGISPKDFKYEKDKFKQYFLTKTYYGNNASAICDFNVLSIFSGQKHADIKKRYKRNW